MGRKIQNVIYKLITVNSDRIAGIQLVMTAKIVLTLLSVYLPYYNSTTEHLQLYNETLDILQSTMHTVDASLVIIVGDMNKSLPQQQQLPHHWYRAYPFTVYSNILHDLLCNNDVLFYTTYQLYILMICQHLI